MKIAIIGASRGIGHALVKAALAAGHDVTALVRDPASLSEDQPSLRLVIGDAGDRAAVAKAVSGQQVVYDCLGTKSVTKSVTLFSCSAANLAATLKPDQLLIAVTGIGAGDSAGHGGFLYDRIFMPLVLRRMYDDKDRQERIIRDKIARWIIVRPGFLTNGPLTGTYRALTDLRGVHGGKISRADVAEFLLSQAAAPRFEGQAPLLIY